MKAFTLPDGSGVLLHELTQEDWNQLRRWAQKTYIEDVSSAVNGMSEQMQYIMIREAVDVVTNASFDMGLCLEILFGSPVGVARVHYQMIQNPNIPFESFFGMVFPHSLFMRAGIEAYTEGFIVLNQMCETVYGAPIDKVFWSSDVLEKKEESGTETEESTPEENETEAGETETVAEETQEDESTEGAVSTDEEAETTEDKKDESDEEAV